MEALRQTVTPDPPKPNERTLALRPMEQPGSEIENVKNTLRSIPKKNVSSLLNNALIETTFLDKNAKVAIAFLDNIEPVQVRGKEYKFYAGRILKDGYINYLRKENPYHILSGVGELTTKVIENNEAKWNEPQIVRAGDTRMIKEDSQIHFLINEWEQPLELVFACPPEKIPANINVYSDKTDSGEESDTSQNSTTKPYQ